MSARISICKEKLPASNWSMFSWISASTISCEKLSLATEHTEFNLTPSEHQDSFHLGAPHLLWSDTRLDCIKTLNTVFVSQPTQPLYTASERARNIESSKRESEGESEHAGMESGLVSLSVSFTPLSLFTELIQDHSKNTTFTHRMSPECH